MSHETHSSVWTRREALKMLGLGAAAMALPRFSFAAELTFAEGAVIRTVLKDYNPQELAGTSTLFHEHMSFADDFMTRWNRYYAETRAANSGRGAGGGRGDGAKGGATKGAAKGGEGRAAKGKTADAEKAAGQQGEGSKAAAAKGGARGAASADRPYFMQDVELMADEMKIAKSEGIGCIVDGGHPDMGRNVDFLRKISQQSGMPIVAGGGFYTQPFYPAEISTMSEQQIFEALVKQVESDPIGVFGEIGSWDEMTNDERKVFRAVGKAHVATNLPIFTHTGIPGKAALEQLDLLEGAGVKPNRIVIGHLGNLVDTDVKVHKEICKRGAFIGFDRQGGRDDNPVVGMVLKLLEAGYADNLMFSADISSASTLKRNGGQGYAKTLTVFVPKIKAAGVSDEVLHKIMQDNPRRFLAFVPKIKRKD